jgi:hypothetical protein
MSCPHRSDAVYMSCCTLQTCVARLRLLTRVRRFPSLCCRRLNVQPQACPPNGCSLDFDTPDSLRGTLYWSDANTWIYRPGGKPQDVSTKSGSHRDSATAVHVAPSSRLAVCS